MTPLLSVDFSCSRKDLQTNARASPASLRYHPRTRQFLNSPACLWFAPEEDTRANLPVGRVWLLTRCYEKLTPPKSSYVMRHEERIRIQTNKTGQIQLRKPNKTLSKYVNYAPSGLGFATPATLPCTSDNSIRWNRPRSSSGPQVGVLWPCTAHKIRE